MSFGQAVSTCLSKYFTGSGRARRSEYWWFYLFTLIAYVVALVLDAATKTPIFVVIVALGLVLPSLAAGVRRLHDTSRSGWWLLVAIIPLIGSIVLLVYLASDSTPQTNQYGPVPA